MNFARQKSLIAFKHKELEKEVKYYSEHKSVFYPDARKKSEDKIIKLCVDLVQNGENVSEKGLEVFNAIIKERNGRNL